MRRVRLSYTGSYHHVMNRGIHGEAIFPDDRAKSYFLKILERKTRDLKMKIFAYCLMDNHYHLILQNSSTKLSEFMKQLNGHYAIYYRKRKGGIGYVFQNRFKSTLIQEDRYLKMTILYVLLNPVRGGKARFPWEYRWSSIAEYYTGQDSLFIDNEFVEELFKTRKSLEKLLIEWTSENLPIRRTRFGNILGEDKFIKQSIKKFDRRTVENTSCKMRRTESSFKSIEHVIKEFENKRQVRIEEINLNNHKGKALRAEILVLLKDEAGLTYSKIIQYPLFQSLKYSSLGQLYKRTKARMAEEKEG